MPAAGILVESNNTSLKTERRRDTVRETEKRKPIIDVPALVSLSDGTIAGAEFDRTKNFLTITTNVDPSLNSGYPLVIHDHRTRTLDCRDSPPSFLPFAMNLKARVIVSKGTKGDERIGLFDPTYPERGVVLREIFFIPDKERRERILWFAGGISFSGFYAIALEDFSETEKLRERNFIAIPLPA